MIALTTIAGSGRAEITNRVTSKELTAQMHPLQSDLCGGRGHLWSGTMGSASSEPPAAPIIGIRDEVRCFRGTPLIVAKSTN